MCKVLFFMVAHWAHRLAYYCHLAKRKHLAKDLKGCLLCIHIHNKHFELFACLTCSACFLLRVFVMCILTCTPRNNYSPCLIPLNLGAQCSLQPSGILIWVCLAPTTNQRPWLRFQGRPKMHHFSFNCITPWCCPRYGEQSKQDFQWAQSLKELIKWFNKKKELMRVQVKIDMDKNAPWKRIQNLLN